jgi:hypothetical protein
MLTPTGLSLIAVSFHRLFLGGLLPSRARFRFPGSLPIPLHMKLVQSRAVSAMGCSPKAWQRFCLLMQKDYQCKAAEDASVGAAWLRFQTMRPEQSDYR